MFVEGVKDSRYLVKNMIMKLTPVFINSNWIPDDYRQAFQFSVKADWKPF